MNLRFCIVIPTFDNPDSIATVIRDCTEKTDLPILVIDDGSPVPVESILSELILEKSNRVQVFRHETNLGKGRAIQTAFRIAIQQEFTHILTFDGDGQHYASEVQKVIDLARAHPWDLIVGNRKLSGKSVPQLSKFGRKFSNFWVKFETELDVKDSQSGFRVYPLYQDQNLKFWTTRYDFEIEVLIRLIWRHVQVHEIEIECYYPPPPARVTHFHRFWDNARISFLNLTLVTISLLRKPQSSFQTATAFALGVFVGVTPLYGLHTSIVAGIAFLFRLNFIYLWIGTQISFPILAPFLAYASFQIAKTLMVSWLYGLLILAGILGLATFGIVFTLMIALAQWSKYKQKRQPSETKAWSGKTRGGKFGNWLIISIARFFGLKSAYFCIYFILPYFYCFAPTGRKALSQYWKHLKPELGFFAQQIQILKHFHQFARVLLDRVFQSFKSEPQFTIRSIGFENILDTIDRRSGLMMITSHVGGWDLAARTLQKKKNSIEFRMVKFEAEGLTFEKVSGIDQDQKIAHTVFDIRELLLKGYPVGIMGDRPMSRHQELVLFLGKLALLDTTPFRIAQLCDVPVVFTFGLKSTSMNYDFYCSSARKYTSPIDGLRDYSRELEVRLREYPDQWFNFFLFWDVRPF